MFFIETPGTMTKHQEMLAEAERWRQLDSERSPESLPTTLLNRMGQYFEKVGLRMQKRAGVLNQKESVIVEATDSFRLVG